MQKRIMVLLAMFLLCRLAPAEPAPFPVGRLVLTGDGDALGNTVSNLDLSVYAGTGVVWNGSQFMVFVVTNLSDLADVDVSSVSTNDLLGFDGTKWVPVAPSVGYNDSWTNGLRALAWLSSISSNQVDAETDAAYRSQPDSDGNTTNVLDLVAGGETNTAKVLTPDGTGGVAWWTDPLGSLAWLSSITSNNVDPDTDAAYRGGGETLWPASSNSVLTHVASHGVLAGGGFVAGQGADGGTGAGVAIGPFASNDFTDGIAIGANATASGVAIGPDAKCLSGVGEPINAIQLGTGSNNTVNSFQVYGWQIVDGSGIIPVARLSNITSNQIASETDTAYRNVPPTGITSNQMDQATDAAYRSATTETKSYWSLTMSGDQNNILGTNYNVVAFDTVVSSGGASTIYTNTYSAKFGTTGVFHLGMRVRHSGMDAAKPIRSQFLITGNAQPEDGRDVNASSSDSAGMLFQWNAIVVVTNADATVQVTFYTTDTENDVDLLGNCSTFFGAKVSDL